MLMILELNFINLYNSFTKWKNNKTKNKKFKTKFILNTSFIIYSIYCKSAMAPV